MALTSFFFRTCSIAGDRTLKTGTVPGIPGRLVTLHYILFRYGACFHQCLVKSVIFHSRHLPQRYETFPTLCPLLIPLKCWGDCRQSLIHSVHLSSIRTMMEFTFFNPDMNYIDLNCVIISLKYSSIISFMRVIEMSSLLFTWISAVCLKTMIVWNYIYQHCHTQSLSFIKL